MSCRAVLRPVRRRCAAVVVARPPLGDDRGTASTIVLFPVFMIVTFAIVQALSWQHDRQVIAAEADRASTAVALYGATEGSTQVDATQRLTAAGIDDVEVSITRGADTTVVVIRGRVPGILIGTSSTVTARSVTPTDVFDTP